MLTDETMTGLDETVPMQVTLDLEERHLISELRSRARAGATPIVIVLPGGATNTEAIQQFARETEAIVAQGSAFIAVAIPNDLDAAALNRAAQAAAEAAGNVVADWVENRGPR